MASYVVRCAVCNKGKDYMKEHEKILKILKLIEAGPQTPAEHDEIDARFWCYFNQYIYLHNGNSDYYNFKYSVDGRGIKIESVSEGLRYSRSIDAQIKCYPEGWDWYASTLEGLHSFIFHKGEFRGGDFEIELLGETKSTMQLAALHALVQTIAHERGE